MGIRLNCRNGENESPSYYCGYSHWNMIKQQMIQACNIIIYRYVPLTAQFQIEFDNIKMELQNNPSFAVVPFLTMYSNPKWKFLFDFLNIEGIYIFLCSSDSDDKFTTEQSYLIEKSINVILPFITFYKSDILEIQTIFSESVKGGNPVILH